MTLLYLFVVPGYWIALASYWTLDYFLGFNIGFVTALILMLVTNSNTLRSRVRRFEVHPSHFAFVAPAIVVVTVVTLHSVFVEFDALFIYMPVAKSIFENGGLAAASQGSLLGSAESPMMPLLYAMMMSIGGLSNFDLAVRIIPLIFFALTGIVTYSLASEVFRDRISSYIAGLCFFSLPITLAVGSAYSLYLDLPFTLIAYIILYAIIKIYRESSTEYWSVILGISSCLLMLVKPTAYILSLPILALLLPVFLRKSTKWIAAACAGLFVGTYLILSVMDFITYWSLLSGLLLRSTPILVILPLSYFAFRRLMRKQSFTKVGLRSFAIIGLLLMPAIFYITHNLIVFGGFDPYFLPFNKDWHSAQSIIGQAAGTIKFLPSDLSLLRWDSLFLDTGLGAVFLIPSIIGFFGLVRSTKEKDVAESLVLIFFMLLITLWSWWYYAQFIGPALRQVYYFAPFFSLLTARGIRGVGQHYKIPEDLRLKRFVVFDLLILGYVWIVLLNIPRTTIEDLRLQLVWSLGLASIGTISISVLIFLICFVPFYKSFRGEERESKL